MARSGDLLPPLQGEGRGGDGAGIDVSFCKAAQIASPTASISCNTWLFQNRSTSGLLQAPVTHVIPLVLQMLPAIDLHNQPPFHADKVQHVVEERMLAAELAACNLPAAQTLP